MEISAPVHMNPWISIFYSFLNVIQFIVIATSTINPPITENNPGTSPMVRNTQRGFNIGSTSEINVASSAVILLIALEYKT